MKKLFGTDGMRGEAGRFPLDRQAIFVVGSSLARHFGEKSGRRARFVTGRDTRESGAWIENALCAGARAAGAEIESAGVMTTPGVAFLTKRFGFDAGIVVSASHNPFEDNGIKIFTPDGRKLDEATERRIEADIFAARAAAGDSFDSHPECDSSNDETFRRAYLDYLAEEFKNLRLENLKIVLDCANGAAFSLAPELFARFGAEIIAINDRPDGRNINENCGSLHLENLQQKVSREKADFGVAFDGDADRALFVDERGSLVDGDATLWAMANHLRAHGRLKNDTVVATVMSNLGLETALREKNIRLVRTSVGDKYVLQELLESKTSIGGEQSGHIIFPERSLVGDGMLTTLFLLETMTENRKALSEITAGFVRFPQILLNVKVREKRPFEEVPEVFEASEQLATELGSRGRLLLRYSGTENLARVMVEGENQAAIEAQARRLAEVIRTTLG